MSGFPILDLVVGMIFIYFLLSILSSAAVEMIMTTQKIRAKVLTKWLLRIFDKPITQPDNTQIPLGQAIMDHCSTTALSGPGQSTSYIDAKNFTSVLLEKIALQADPTIIAKNIDEYIALIQKSTILSTEFKRVLLNYANEAKDSYQVLVAKTMSELELFRTKVENWYDSSMDRLTGALKRHCRRFTFTVACIMTIVLNADSIAITKYLYSNPTARASLVAKAYETGKDDSIKAKMAALKNAIPADKQDTVEKTQEQISLDLEDKLKDLNEANAAVKSAIPVGWGSTDFKGIDNWFLFIISKIGGFAATVLAIAMGAPFWFDILNKIANLRGTGPKPPVTPDEDSKK